MTAPPMAYYGGKTRLAAKIAALLPAHEHYIEPFAGSLAVLLAKKPSRMETVNDLDGLLMTFWRVLRDKPDELARVCALTPHSRAEYSAAREADLDDLDDVERARLIWVQIAQGRGGTLRKTGWRSYIDPAGCSSGMPRYLDGYVERMAVAAERLHQVSLECRPALDIVKQYGAYQDCCLYVDPPYLGSSRTDGGGTYRHEMKSRDEHLELVWELLGCRASVLLSGYPSDLYDDALRGWHRLEIPTMTGQSKTARARTEVIWSNRPISSQGAFNFTEEATA
ncbi:DNA adenine methylase [Mycobacterium sp. NAZ190054]|uniref:DNA adenine methylase n=1 Tax=Mycobacterium sp. NAZ190054 TaxID=1747766 RepID=UPI000A97CB58|nr:DNA adenine methylase [Mycobacterium sp. NAZ190054]